MFWDSHYTVLDTLWIPCLQYGLYGSLSSVMLQRRWVKIRSRCSQTHRRCRTTRWVSIRLTCLTSASSTLRSVGSLSNRLLLCTTWVSEAEKERGWQSRRKGERLRAREAESEGGWEQGRGEIGEREGDSSRGNKRGRKRERKKEEEKKRRGVCVCVFVCFWVFVCVSVSVWECECVWECVCVRERERERERGWERVWEGGREREREAERDTKRGRNHIVIVRDREGRIVRTRPSKCAQNS